MPFTLRTAAALGAWMLAGPDAAFAGNREPTGFASARGSPWPRVHFGLGNYSGPVDVEVEIPGEGRWQEQGLSVDRLYVLRLP